MERTRLGRSDLEVSRVGLGCNNFGRRLDLARTREVVDAAVDAGITFFDTADIYGFGESERFLGDVLGNRRERVMIATKFGNDMQGANGNAPGGSRAYVRRAIDASLRRLGADHVDLYYYHRPDGVTPLEETLGAMGELVVEGKVRWLGVSNVDATQLEQAVDFVLAGGRPVVAVQNYYSLMHRDDDVDILPLCREHQIGYVPYFPLESGLLTGKYRRGEPAPPGSRLGDPGDDRLDDERLVRVEALDAFAHRCDRTLLELAVGGLASIAGVASVIAGATDPEQARANAAAGDRQLAADQLEELKGLVNTSH
jgi:aryl-alcohol dehydrogenase-like predicted oxidoreductase